MEQREELTPINILHLFFFQLYHNFKLVHKFIALYIHSGNEMSFLAISAYLLEKSLH